LPLQIILKGFSGAGGWSNQGKNHRRKTLRALRTFAIDAPVIFPAEAQ